MDRLGLARAEAETLEDQMRSDWDRVRGSPSIIVALPRPRSSLVSTQLA